MSSRMSIDSEDSLSTFHMLLAGMLLEDVGDCDPSYHPCVSSWDFSGLRQPELPLSCIPMSINRARSGSSVVAYDDIYVLSC